jgi:hypothetical protein
MHDAAVPVAHRGRLGPRLRAHRRAVEAELLDHFAQSPPDGLLRGDAVEALAGRVDSRDQAVGVRRHDRLGHLLDHDAADAGRSGQALAQLGVALRLEPQRDAPDDRAHLSARSLEAGGVHDGWRVAAPEQHHVADPALVVPQRGPAQRGHAEGPGPFGPGR